MNKKLLSIILAVVMLFSVTNCGLTVNAATVNTIKTSFSKVESKAKGFKVTWKKKSKINGYQIQYSTSSKFKQSSTKTKTISKATTTYTTIGNLKGCSTKYYVRVRTYKTSKGKKVYSSWSTSKKVTTLEHKYIAATCTKPKTCKYCKKTSGKSLGHKYSNYCDKTCNVCKATRTVKHTYNAATCTKPKTCKYCKSTSGEALNHSWKAATCISPKTCTRCGVVTGNKLGHDWVVENSSLSQVCSRCGSKNEDVKYYVGIQNIFISDIGELTITLTNNTTINLGVINGTDGKDGIGIVKTEINDNGELIITYSDSTIENLGLVVGGNGKDGKDAISIVKTEINENGELVLYFSNNTNTNLGKIIGKDGLGIADITLKDNGELSVSMTDGKILELGNIKGPQGEKGEQGYTPYIGPNGNWFINGEDTGHTSRGNDGESSSIAIGEDGYWIINGEKTEYNVSASKEELIESFESIFDYERDQFISTQETCSKPSWCYTNSTFSGWGGSIGAPSEIEAIAICVRARDKAITKIKFHLTHNDKNGKVLLTEVLDVYIPPYSEQEIIWKLPSEITNNTEYLYLSYNCNQLCDLYSNITASAQIPSNQYQAVQTYTTNGNLLSSASSMTNVAGSPARYLYAKIGIIKDVFIPKKEFLDSIHEKINIFLPDRYELVANDNFQLFYRGVVQAVNPYNYAISITCAKGKAYPRYFEWTPTADDVGSYKLTLRVYNNNGVLLGVDSTTLVVCNPPKEQPVKNVLCFGDSLTAGGYWVSELARRFSAEDGRPKGLGLDCLNFVGTQNKTLNGVNINHEGYAGWTWERFCSSKSPFYDSETQDISFKKYCEKNGIETLDVVCILLTWNSQGTPYKTNFDLSKNHFLYAQKIIDKLHSEYPECKVICMGIQIPSQNGGMGSNYGANGGYSDTYGMTVTAMNYNDALEDFCQLSQNKDFVKYVDIAGQFDTDYNMPSAAKPVNNRSEQTEIVGTNGVHPTINGYYQIADAIFRAMCHTLQ